MTAPVTEPEGRLFPALLRHWRTRRGLSQLDLSLAAEVSSRHVSFLETGRAKPSRAMLLRLADALSVPLRDQNDLLQAAGFRREHAEPGPSDLPPPIEQAIVRMMQQQEPYPLTVLDRGYDVVRANAAAMRLLGLFVRDPGALPARPNVYRMLFDPRLGREFVVDWPRVARALLSRLQREVLAHPEDPARSSLLDALLALPDVPASFRRPDLAAPSEATLTFRLRRGETTLAFLTTVTAFNAPHNVTLEELRIESWFPLDDETARACEALARAATSSSE